MRIGLASASFPSSLSDGLGRVLALLEQAAEQRCDLVCFGEAYLPGLRDQGWPVEPYDYSHQEAALEEIRTAAGRRHLAVILGMEWEGLIAAFVIGRDGELLGCQTKNQIAPEEEAQYRPGSVRQLFTLDGVSFGIAICHEGWRYPETVRWAAARGAQVVFHPNCTYGPVPERFGDSYYEKAMICRAAENTVYFASVNYALPNQACATALIDPNGECVARHPYGEEGVLVCDLDLEQATGLLARRFNLDRYRSAGDGAGAEESGAEQTRARLGGLPELQEREEG